MVHEKRFTMIARNITHATKMKEGSEALFHFVFIKKVRRKQIFPDFCSNRGIFPLACRGTLRESDAAGDEKTVKDTLQRVLRHALDYRWTLVQQIGWWTTHESFEYAVKIRQVPVTEEFGNFLNGELRLGEQVQCSFHPLIMNVFANRLIGYTFEQGGCIVGRFSDLIPKIFLCHFLPIMLLNVSFHPFHVTMPLWWNDTSIEFPVNIN